jgi:hypothetical protein
MILLILVLVDVRVGGIVICIRVTESVLSSSSKNGIYWLAWKMKAPSAGTT